MIRQNILNFEGTRWQYTYGVANPESVAPESYTLDACLLERPGNKEIQLDLFLDYASNVKLYPKFQEYLRKSKPPLLAIWGKNDPFFIPAGAEAFRKDLPNAQVQFLDTGSLCHRDARCGDSYCHEGVSREGGFAMKSSQMGDGCIGSRSLGRRILLEQRHSPP